MPRTKQLISQSKIKQLGTNIKNQRVSLNMSQKELSKKIRISQQQISRFEKGERFPNIFQAESIAKILNTTIEKLLTR